MRLATPPHPPGSLRGSLIRLPLRSHVLRAAHARAGVAVAAVVVIALSACGYALETRYVAKGGAERVHVRPIENLSTEASLGAELTAALRDELARRGAAAGPGAPAEIVGEVRAGAPGPSTRGATWRIGVELKARLVVDGATVSERTVRREADYLAGVGADALETEGRRALALRQVAGDAARELLRAFER